MGFFDFIFGGKQAEYNNDSVKVPTTRSTAISPIEEIVISCIQDMKLRSQFSILNLEPEAINLATYIFLRGEESIDFKLDFLPNGLIEKTFANDYSESDRVFTFFVKHSSGLYNNQHAEFGKKAYKLNINLDKTIDQTLRYHFHKIHNVIIPKKETVKPVSNNEAVDLGLPSGLLWGSKNVGASTEYDNGSYFAWGEISDKDYYGWETFKHANGSFNTMKKYCEKSNYGIVDNKFILDDSDDAAQVVLGDKWHTPSSDELQELIDNCKWQWEIVSGMYGWRIIGSNGNSIFLPAVGAYSACRLASVNEIGRYWCSNMESTHSAFGLRFNDEEYKIVDDTKFYGRPIRPVFGDKCLIAKKIKETKKTENTEKKTLYPHKKVSVSELVGRTNDQVSDIGKIVDAILIILKIDTDTILNLTLDDKNEIYKTYCSMNAICISELCKNNNTTFNRQCDKLAGVYAYKKISSEENIPENYKFAYAIGAEAMWRTFDWNYTVGYVYKNTEKDKKEFKDKTILEIKEFAKNAIADLNYSETEKQYFMRGAVSLVEDKLVGTSVYRMLSMSFPNIFE